MVNDSWARGGEWRGRARAHLDGGCWGCREEVGGLVEVAVEVANEGHNVAEDRVRVGAVVAAPPLATADARRMQTEKERHDSGVHGVSRARGSVVSSCQSICKLASLFTAGDVLTLTC